MFPFRNFAYKRKLKESFGIDASQRNERRRPLRQAIKARTDHRPGLCFCGFHKIWNVTRTSSRAPTCRTGGAEEIGAAQCQATRTDETSEQCYAALVALSTAPEALPPKNPFQRNWPRWLGSFRGRATTTIVTSATRTGIALRVTKIRLALSKGPPGTPAPRPQYRY